MKRLFLALLGFGATLSVVAQTTTAQPTGVKLSPNVQPNTIVLNQFAAAYPNISPAWSLHENVYSAEYRNPDTNLGRVVSYDLQGSLVSIENELNSEGYPVAVGQYYAKKYPREKYEVWSWEDGMGNKMYYILRGEESIWFSTEGKLIPNTKGNKVTSRQLKYAE